MKKDNLKEKILTFIVNENKQFLLLKCNNNDAQFHKSFWYVVTGYCEEDINKFETVKREVKEETNLDVIESIYLDKVFKYTSLNNDCIEYVYLSKVKNVNVILNEENIDYKWCDFNEFINLIHWFESKTSLINLLKDFNFNI